MFNVAQKNYTEKKENDERKSKCGTKDPGSESPSEITLQANDSKNTLKTYIWVEHRQQRLGHLPLLEAG